MRPRWRRSIWLVVLAVAAACDCGGGEQPGDGGTLPDAVAPDDGSGTGEGETGPGGPGGEGGIPGEGGAPPGLDAGEDADFWGIDAGGVGVMCGDHVCQCADGMDNDGDGDADGFDPECTGPYDDDESSFATGIPGDNRDPIWQDCFFDGNSGHGDDGCRIHTDCLTGELPPSDRRCRVTDECRRNCLPRTSNGCDCFGCCEVRLPDGSTRWVLSGAGCDLEELSGCTSCTPIDACLNECERCELCPGKGPEDLPDDCTPPPPPPPGDGGSGIDAGADGGSSEPPWSCEDGTSCASDADCGASGYCQLGCCVPIVR